MKKALLIGIVLFSIVAHGQRYRRSDGTALSKPISVSNIPSGMGYYYDTLQYKWRPFQSTAEVISFYPNLADRQGAFPIYVKTGGTLSNGVIMGGILSKWWFKNGTADSNLVNMDDYNFLTNKPDLSGSVPIANTGTVVPTPINGQTQLNVVSNGAQVAQSNYLNDGVTPIVDAMVDNILVYKINGAYYTRQYTGGADVRWWNAVGNGSTNDVLAIKSAFNSIATEITIPYGYTFYVADSFSITKPMRLSGGGTIKAAFINTDVLTINSDNVTIDGITINNGYASVDSNTTYGSGIYSAYHNNIDITNCNINSSTGIRIWGGSNINILNCNVSFSEAAIGVSGAYNLFSIFPFPTNRITENVTIENCHVSINNHAWRNQTRGININDCNNGTIKNCTSFGAQLCYEVGGAIPTASENMHNSNILIDGCTGDRWMCVNATNGAKVINSYMDYSLLPANASKMGNEYSFAVGLEILGNRNYLVQGNTFKHFPAVTIQGGIQDNPYKDTLSTSTRNGIISNNQFIACDTSSTSVYYVMSLSQCAAVKVEHNTFDSCGGLGSIEFAGNDAFPIYNAEITNNTFSRGSGVAIRTYWSRDVKINDNKISDYSQGIDIGYVTWASRVTANNNMIKHCTGIGFKVFVNTVEVEAKNNTSLLNGVDFDVNDGNSAPFGKIFNNVGQIQNVYPPLSGTFSSADVLPINVGKYVGLKCMATGTQGTLTGVTGTIASGTNKLKLNATTWRVTEGQYLTVGGNVYQVLSVGHDTAYLSSNAPSTLIATSVNYSNAEFATFGDSYGKPMGTGDLHNLPSTFGSFEAFTPANAPIANSYYSGFTVNIAQSLSNTNSLFSGFSGEWYRINKSNNVYGNNYKIWDEGNKRSDLVNDSIYIQYARNRADSNGAIAKAYGDLNNPFVTPFQASNLHSIPSNFNVFYSTFNATNNPTNVNFVSGLQLSSDNNPAYKKLIMTDGSSLWVAGETGGTWGSITKMQNKSDVFSVSAPFTVFSDKLQDQTYLLKNTNGAVSGDVDFLSGTKLFFKNNGTIADTINFPTTSYLDGSTGVTSILPAKGSTLTIISTGGSNWVTLSSPITAATSNNYSYDGLAFNSAATQSFTPTGTNDKIYSIGGLLKIKAITTDTLTYTVSYRDLDSIPQTITYKNTDGTTVFATTGNRPFPTMEIAVKAGTAITFAVALPNSSGTISYNVHVDFTYIRLVSE